MENAYEIRRHPASLRCSLIAAYCWLRAQEITDDLIELLIQIIRQAVCAEMRLPSCFQASAGHRRQAVERQFQGWVCTAAAIGSGS